MDAGYDAARAVWNATIDRRPAAIVRCTGTADVVAGLAFARARDVRVAVRGGGHNIAGPGGLRRRARARSLAAARRDRRRRRAHVAHVQPGSTWGDVDAATQADGLAAPGGIVSITGVAGFTLGGGIGWLTRPCGPACDSLVGAEVVTADGAVVEAAEDADLLWGLRGGGGNFGVVTRLDLRLHPVGPHVLAGPVAFELHRLRGGARGPARAGRGRPRRARDDADAAPAVHRRLGAGGGARRAGRSSCISAGRVTSPRGRRALAPLGALGPPLAAALGEQALRTWQRFFDAAWQPGLQNYWKAEYLDRGSTRTALGALRR